MQWLSWAQNNELVSVAIPLVGIFLFRELILRKISSYQIFYYAILFPGVIIHELSHLLGCLLTLTRVKSIKLFSKSGGFVIHEKPRIPILGQFIISIAPLVVGLALSYLLINTIYPGGRLAMLPSTIIYTYFLLSIVMTMLPSGTDIKSSLPAYVAILAMVVIFYKSIDIPAFESVLRLLLILLAVEFVVYIFLSALGQRLVFKVK